MAMALLRQSHGRKVYVASAGVREGEADGFVTAVMGELGVDLRRHYPTLLEDLEDTNFDLIVTLSPEAHHRALELTRTQSVDVEYWPTEDPSVAEGNREERLAAYRLVRDKLADRIADRFL
jgi:protein-tyrosine-phosphatase